MDISIFTSIINSYTAANNTGVTFENNFELHSTPISYSFIDIDGEILARVGAISFTQLMDNLNNNIVTREVDELAEFRKSYLNQMAEANEYSIEFDNDDVEFEDDDFSEEETSETGFAVFGMPDNAVAVETDKLESNTDSSVDINEKLKASGVHFEMPNIAAFQASESLFAKSNIVPVVEDDDFDYTDLDEEIEEPEFEDEDSDDWDYTDDDSEDDTEDWDYTDDDSEDETENEFTYDMSSMASQEQGLQELNFSAFAPPAEPVKPSVTIPSNLTDLISEVEQQPVPEAAPIKIEEQVEDSTPVQAINTTPEVANNEEDYNIDETDEADEEDYYDDSESDDDDWEDYESDDETDEEDYYDDSETDDDTWEEYDDDTEDDDGDWSVSDNDNESFDNSSQSGEDNNTNNDNSYGSESTNHSEPALNPVASPPTVGNISPTQKTDNNTKDTGVLTETARAVPTVIKEQPQQNVVHTPKKQTITPQQGVVTTSDKRTLPAEKTKPPEVKQKPTPARVQPSSEVQAKPAPARVQPSSEVQAKPAPARVQPSSEVQAKSVSTSKPAPKPVKQASKTVAEITGINKFGVVKIYTYSQLPDNHFNKLLLLINCPTPQEAQRVAKGLLKEKMMYPTDCLKQYSYFHAFYPKNTDLGLLNITECSVIYLIEDCSVKPKEDDTPKVTFNKTMSLHEFLRVNPKVRSVDELSKYYDMDVIDRGHKSGVFEIRRGRIIL